MNTTLTKRVVTAVLTVGLGTSLLAACSSTSDEAASLEPIKIGAVSSMTGPAPFPEVPGAAQAVFDRVNAEGGIQGRMIEYISEDDGADPAKASQAARRLVEEDKVVALVGSISLVECSVNAALYAESDVYSLSGTGIEPTCFESSHIAPVNNGTVPGYASLLYFASETLEHERVCPVILESAGLTPTYLDLIAEWEKETGSKAPHIDTSVTLGNDPTSAVLAVRDAQCDAVVFNANEPVATAFMNVVKQQGILDQADWLTLTSAYTETALETLAAQDTLGLYVNSEFLPFTSDDEAVREWRELLESEDVARTSLSQGGYVSAEILVSVLKSIEGEITRESVSEALRNMEEVSHPLLGMPYIVGEADRHNPNRASMMVQATSDGWETVGDWVLVP